MEDQRPNTVCWITGIAFVVMLITVPFILRAPEKVQLDLLPFAYLFLCVVVSSVAFCHGGWKDWTQWVATIVLLAIFGLAILYPWWIAKKVLLDPRGIQSPSRQGCQILLPIRGSSFYSTRCWTVYTYRVP